MRRSTTAIIRGIQFPEDPIPYASCSAPMKIAPFQTPLLQRALQLCSARSISAICNLRHIASMKPPGKRKRRRRRRRRRAGQTTNPGLWATSSQRQKFHLGEKFGREILRQSQVTRDEVQVALTILGRRAGEHVNVGPKTSHHSWNPPEMRARTNVSGGISQNNAIRGSPCLQPSVCVELLSQRMKWLQYSTGHGPLINL